MAHEVLMTKCSACKGNLPPLSLNSFSKRLVYFPGNFPQTPSNNALVAASTANEPKSRVSSPLYESIAYLKASPANDESPGTTNERTVTMSPLIMGSAYMDACALNVN